MFVHSQWQKKTIIKNSLQRMSAKYNKCKKMFHSVKLPLPLLIKHMIKCYRYLLHKHFIRRFVDAQLRREFKLNENNRTINRKK